MVRCQFTAATAAAGAWNDAWPTVVMVTTTTTARAAAALAGVNRPWHCHVIITTLRDVATSPATPRPRINK